MDERFGGEWELGTNVFEKSGVMHMFSPGGHRWKTAVIAASGIKLDKKKYELTDVYDIIMSEMR